MIYKSPETLMAEREQFIRDNAVSLVEQRDAKILRQQRRISQLESMVANLRDALRNAVNGQRGE